MGYKITDIIIDRSKEETIDIKTEMKTPILMDDNTERMGKIKKIFFSVLTLIVVIILIVWSINAQANIIIESQQAYIEIQNLPIDNSIVIPLVYTYATTTKVSSYQNIQQKSSGLVTFYNEFSTTAQKLNTETKIRTQSGLIYKTRSAITIPGYKKSGNKTIPGTIQVSVDAEKIGPNYNSNAGQMLTISSYQGTTRGAKLYAKSNGITGGANDKKPVFSESSTQKSQAEAFKTADVSFIQTVRGIQDEPGILVVYGSSTLKSQITNVCCSRSDVGTTTMTISGFAYRIDQGQIITALLNKYKLKIKEQMSESVDIDVESLGVDPIGGVDGLTIENGKPLITKATWRVYTKLDPAIIKKYIQGKSLQTALTLIQANSHARAEISINPFWVRTVPLEIERINIEFKH